MKKWNLFWHRFRGKGFRVSFRKGGVSAPLPYNEASYYASIFQGVVVPTDEMISWHPAAPGAPCRTSRQKAR